MRKGATNMLLERIRLRAFGCFQEQDFELHEGINLIFGPNFSGKSTLVNAIFFTLTGKPIVPRVDASAIKSAKAYSGTAGLQFVVNGERYQLFRATGKRIQLRTEKNGGWQVLFDEKRVRVTESLLQERFGIMHEQLALTTFLREGEIFEFLARQSTTRRDILHTLLGIDRLIQVRQRFIDTRRIAKREQGRIRAHQNSLRFNAQNVNEAEITRIEAKLKDLEAAYSSETGDSALIAEWVQHQSRLQKQLDTLTQQQNEALSGFNDIGQLREMITTIEAAIQEASGLEAKRDELIQQTGRLESEIEALTNVCNTLQTLIESDKQHCPTCYQQVEKEVVQRIIDEKAEEKSQRSAELEIHRESLKEQTAELESRRGLEQRLQGLQNSSRQFQQRAQDIDKIQTELNALASRLSERGVQQSEQTPSDTITSLDKPQLKAQIDSERERLGKLKQEEAVRLDRLGALQRVNRDAAKVERTLLSIELACTGIDKTIEALQRQILKPAEDELHHWLDKMQLFSVSRENGGQTRIDLQRDHLLPSLNIDGADRSLMLLSGSEKMFLYLCFKVALAKVLGNPGFFVFDDPTLHLDGERKTLMVDFIHQLAEEHQVLVTSYDEDVRAGLEGAHIIEMSRET
ncbi:MAG: AAA family ATPase [Candidatus Poribacteria bacterium]|nr:AAA family ATPase [Candidatus Poribacteria bacterium]